MGHRPAFTYVRLIIRWSPGAIEIRQDLWHTRARTKKDIIMPVGFGQVVIDSLRADDIAGFWSALLRASGRRRRKPVLRHDPASADAHIPRVDVPGRTGAAPRARTGVHLDLVADDLAAEVERAVTLGATKVADFQRIRSDLDNLDRPRRQHLRCRLEADTEPASG